MTIVLQSTHISVVFVHYLVVSCPDCPVKGLKLIGEFVYLLNDKEQYKNRNINLSHM